MLLLALLFGAGASARDGCPDLSEEVAVAWDLFDDAELEVAKERIGSAYEALRCQPDVVPESALLELYRLDALVSLAQQDQKGAVYATIRAVAADHVGGAPPEEYGPKLAELYALWAERLAETLVRVNVLGGGKVWIDGRPVDASSPRQVAQGEHLIQVRDGGRLASELHDLSEDIEIATTDPLPEGFVPPTTPDDTPRVPPEPVSARPRRRPAGLLVGGGLAAVVGAGCLTFGAMAERSFHDDPFDARSYSGCPAGAACYRAARRDAVEAAATRVRILYVAGYGSATVGVGVLGLAIAGLPASAAPAGFSLTRRF